MKELDIWNEQKKKIVQSEKIVQFKERDIFFIKMGQNIGFEQNGRGEIFARPVVIIKKLGTYSFIGIPLTTKKKNGDFYYSFQFKDKGERVAILSQIRCFSVKRCIKKMGMMEKKDFIELKQKMKDLL